MKSQQGFDFSKLTNEEVIRILAFEKSSYRPEIVSTLDRLLSERGLNNQDVVCFRNSNLAATSAYYTCCSCSGELTLSRDDLVAGEFTCPMCKETNQIVYGPLLQEAERATSIEVQEARTKVSLWTGISTRFGQCLTRFHLPSEALLWGKVLYTLLDLVIVVGSVVHGRWVMSVLAAITIGSLWSPRKYTLLRLVATFQVVYQIVSAILAVKQVGVAEGLIITAIVAVLAAQLVFVWSPLRSRAEN